jgi:DNA repair protein RecO (recombination protein O)
LLLDVFSRDHGRLALVARGARAQKSRLKPILRPFMPLQLSWLIRADLGTLTGGELDGQPLSLAGDALLSGYYLNELILHLLHRHDAQPEVFAAYHETIVNLAACDDPAPILRVFEIELLRLLGYEPSFDHEAISHEPLLPDSNYEYRPEQGAVAVSRGSGPMVFRGAMLLAIGELRFEDPEVLRAGGRLLRRLIAYHLGGKELKSRKVLVELHRSRAKIESSDSERAKEHD